MNKSEKSDQISMKAYADQFGILEVEIVRNQTEQEESCHNLQKSEDKCEKSDAVAKKGFSDGEKSNVMFQEKVRIPGN